VNKNTLDYWRARLRGGVQKSAAAVATPMPTILPIVTAAQSDIACTAALTIELNYLRVQVRGADALWLAALLRAWQQC
jgi:hypothetical protein